MAWQCILGIIIMVASFVGVLIAAKKHLQPIAMTCAVLMLVGLGMYAWFYMNPPPDTSYMVYGQAVAQKSGEILKGNFSKAIWITTDTTSENSKTCAEIFKAAFGGEVELVSPGNSDDGMMDLSATRLKEIIKAADPNAVIVLDCSIMDASKAEFLKGAYKGPKFFIASNGSVMGASTKAVANAFKKGNIVGAVVYVDNADPDFKPSDSDLAEAFSKRYMIVTADNFAEFKDKFGM